MNYKKNKNKLLYREDEHGCKILTPYGGHVNQTLFEYVERLKVMEREYLELFYSLKKTKVLCMYKDLSIERQRAELRSKDEIIKKLKSQIPAPDNKK